MLVWNHTLSCLYLVAILFQSTYEISGLFNVDNGQLLFDFLAAKKASLLADRRSSGSLASWLQLKQNKGTKSVPQPLPTAVMVVIPRPLNSPQLGL